MVFCLENEMPHRLLRSTMVHFQASEVQQLLHNKFVVILGDSIQRAVYKDLVLLLQKDSLLTASQLKAKGELSFEQDQLVAGGQLGELHNGTQYREVRQFCSGSGHHLVRFYFLTRVYSEYLEDVLKELSYGPAPDLVIINSCLWDLSRYGRCPMESYRENLERVFVRMDQVLPDSCLLVWNMAMPLGERVTGGFLLPELQPLAVSLRQDVVEGNFYSATLAGNHCFDVLDLHFHFRHAVRHRHRDGVHWDQHAHRHLSHLLLTHVADAWGVELPKHDPLPDPWIEDWPEMDHPFRGSHKQPPDFREKLALPLLPPFHLPPPMSFPYPLLQPSPPPLIPPLHQNAPFFQGQPFPPYEFFKHSAMEDFSMPSNLGCGPGMNFVPGPLPPPVSGPVSHGQHRGPVVHRGKPRCVPNNPYHVPRIGGTCRQRLRHSDRLMHTYKQDRRGHAHSGTWPG
ncbi:PC-esterase domain-containing protein 1A [Cricetulus griseus]|uniref:PC-esterase domain containing 1A n=1 Tax=Cricetulus griseus TaxID=10029 RepID=G3H446_CRIGR|nr:PC-esterase domain-containing protein 1A [Cricetulus griseus]XP_007635345.1 PC-esterase domain-containing protein 1A [Cricetulus griseus]XP_027277602.1 PC-esterase domain-containing protein 1A [Cricetulus griseus]XP_027277603.1 PC-esterase domain-containing protein 1A [Cricetulus griseus]EGV92438.1 Protein FAM113A [Cricetulus griseus]ERE69812.1 Esterase, SGNH hydrolase-type containing protein [Cricetulus griseus]